MAKTIRIINIAIICVWIALMTLLFYRDYSGTSIDRAGTLKASINKSAFWYDIYAGSTKIGFAHTTFEKVGDEIILAHEREMKVKKDGNDTVLSDKLRCLSDLSFSIKSFEYTSNFKDAKGIKLSGEVDHDEVIFFLESAGKRKTHKIQKKGREFYLPITFISALVQKNPAPDSVFTVPLLDFASLEIRDIKVSLEEIRPMKVGTSVLSLYKFRAGKEVWWSNEKGMIVKEENPLGFTLYSQVEEIAKDPSDRVLFDYTTVPFFKSNIMLPNAEVLKRLRVRIKGFPLAPELYENSLVALESDILTIEKEDMEDMKKRSYGLPYRDGSLGRYLEADDWVLSDDKNVKGNAHNMAIVEKNDAFRMARYLNSNLYSTVRVLPMFTLLTAKDIFKSHCGDYLERTVMFASFARAAGLPTRTLSGLVCRNGYFYFHAWPEVWVDKWIPMDPALGQFPADVTHIPLKEGTLKNITSIVNDLRNIKIEILEVS